MFQPNNFWERRTALTEAYLMQFMSMVPEAQSLVQDWAHRLDLLKLQHANEILGPAQDIADEFKGTRTGFSQQLADLLQRKGLSLQTGDSVAYEAAYKRIEKLPDLDESFRKFGHADLGLYRLDAGDGSVGLAFAFVHRTTHQVIQHIIIAQGRFSFGCVSLNHIPKEINFAERPSTWRMLVFPYRDDLSQVEFNAYLRQIDESYPDVDEAEDVKVLLGSDVLPAHLETIEGTITLGDLVRKTVNRLGASVSGWNSLPADVRENMLQETLNELQHLKGTETLDEYVMIKGRPFPRRQLMNIALEQAGGVAADWNELSDDVRSEFIQKAISEVAGELPDAPEVSPEPRR